MAAPDSIGRYRVDALLGTGTFATVWLATDPVLDVPVAIKVLADNWSRDLDVRRRFLAEARLLWRADDERIIRVHTVDELDDGRPYFVMAWADRGSLRDRMDTQGTVAPSAAAHLVAEIADAVGVVHRLGAVHRDVKPENVLLRSVPANGRTDHPVPGLAPDERLVLSDLGLVKSLDSSALTMVAGSPAYMAPEQARGDDIDERADVYALGVILFELVTGAVPNDVTTIDAARRRGRASELPTHVDHPAERAVLDRLRPIVASCLEPEPSARATSATEVAAALRRAATVPAMSEQALSGGDVGPVAHPPVRRPGTAVRIAAAAVGVVVAAVAVVVVAQQVGDTTAGTGTDDPTPTAPPTPTVAAAAAPAASPIDIDGLELPAPAGAVEGDRVVDDDGTTRQRLTVAADIDDVTAFYDTLDHPVWEIDAAESTDDVVTTRTLRGTGLPSVLVEIRAAAVTATSGISEIVFVVPPAT